MAFYEANTTSDYYKCGLDITVLDKSNVSSNAKVKVKLTPKLKHTRGARRYQHRWHVYFKVDGNPTKTYSYTADAGNDALPNDASGTDVESAGSMWMTAGRWYQWGDSYIVEIPNDGKKHSFKLYMTCDETIPRHCPAENKWVTGTLKTVGYKITPANPSGFEITYNEDKRTLTYTWNKTNSTCKYTLLKRSLFDSDGNLIPKKSGYIAPKGQDNKLYNKNIPLKEVIPEGVALVKCEIVNVSASGHKSAVVSEELNIDTYSKVFIKVGSAWKKAIPWVKVNGVWKKATKTYVKVGSAWKRTTV